MKQCDHFEMLISALIDGELDERERIAALDHLLTCASCREFYRAARELQELVFAQPVASAEASFAPAATPKTPRRWLPFPCLAAIPRWAYGAAAVLAVATLLWTGGVLHQDVETHPAIPTEEPLTITLGENPDQMDDARFLALTVELLTADPRYHAKMHQILGQLQDSPLGGEETAGFAARGDETGDDRERDTGEHGGEVLVAQASAAWAK